MKIRDAAINAQYLCADSWNTVYEENFLNRFVENY